MKIHLCLYKLQRKKPVVPFYVDTVYFNADLKLHAVIFLCICGFAGDSLSAHRGRQFSTKDQDNDANTGGSCAVSFKGAWWYANCHVSNLNGLYLGGPHTSYADGVEWRSMAGYYYSLKTSEMKIRPVRV